MHSLLPSIAFYWGRGCYVKSVGIKNYDEKLMGIPGA